MGSVVAATAYGGPKVLCVLEREFAAPGPDEVTIAVRASAVNLIDYKLYSGAFGTDPEKLPSGPAIANGIEELPGVPGRATLRCCTGECPDATWGVLVDHDHTTLHTSNSTPG